MTVWTVFCCLCGGFIGAKVICIFARWMCIFASVIPITIQNLDTWDDLSDDEKTALVKEHVEERRKNNRLFRFMWYVGSLDKKKGESK